MFQEQAQAFTAGIPSSMICLWIYNYIENKVDHNDRSYFGAILLTPFGLSFALSIIFSWIYIYKIGNGSNYGVSPVDDWIILIFPWFTYILSFLSTTCLCWGVWKLFKRYSGH